MPQLLICDTVYNIQSAHCPPHSQ